MNHQSHKPRGVKIITLGNKEVGKSCVIRRYCEKRFFTRYIATVGIDYGIMKTEVNDHHLRVNIFDLSGNPVYYEVRKELYNDINGVLLIYDTSKRCSFDSLNFWLSELKRHLSDTTSWDSIVFIVCGNKRDKKREVDECEGQLWAHLHGFLFYEVSAMTGDGVQAMFQALLGNIVKVLEGGPQPPVLRSQFGANKERLDAIRRLRYAKNDYEKLDLSPGASREEINRVYRKLAVLLHPDKSNVPGTEEAFKMLVATRLSLLRHLSH